jgi:hypothetical protein
MSATDRTTTNAPSLENGDHLPSQLEQNSSNNTTATTIDSPTKIILGKRNASLDIAANGVLGLSARENEDGLDGSSRHTSGMNNSPKKLRTGTAGGTTEHIGTYSNVLEK